MRTFADYGPDFGWFAHCLACFRDRDFSAEDLARRDVRQCPVRLADHENHLVAETMTAHDLQALAATRRNRVMNRRLVADSAHLPQAEN